jgi:hypothetical protein
LIDLSDRKESPQKEEEKQEIVEEDEEISPV